MVVDTLGFIIAVAVGSACSGDRNGFILLPVKT
ncbi:hypothetical protein [Waddlia chondrophila]